MLLMIDNYDSFTYNLVQYFGELGEQVKVYRNDQITPDEIAALDPERIVLSPGPCTPNEAGVSLAVIDTFAGQVPILGVCLGHQSIGPVSYTHLEQTETSEPSLRSKSSSEQGIGRPSSNQRRTVRITPERIEDGNSKSSSRRPKASSRL